MNRNIGTYVQIAAAVVPGGTFGVPYPAGYTQADFDPGGKATLSLRGADFNDLAVTFGANAATVTWPASAPYDLPAGEDIVGLPLYPALDSHPTLADLQMPEQSDSTATTVAGIVADFNALLAKLRATQLMK